MTMIQIGHEPDPSKRRRVRQGQTIRNIRTLRRMSVAELAARCDVTVGAVSQWETGRFTPRQEMQVRIARALDVPWSTIFALDAEVAS
ncbi:MAG: helix-turn-helix transcriptional regulator [Pseudomonadota bacterium]|jgi:transcriptional regulator with XRE-family HTH domain